RLLPLSALVLAVTAIASMRIYAPLDHAAIAGDLRASALWFANWHFASASTQYMAATDQSPVLHYWSLSVEEQFYVVWPLLMLLILGRGSLALRSPRAALLRLGAAIAVIGAVSLVLSVTLTSSTGSWAYFGTHTRAWELAAGAGLALARPVLPRLPRAVAALGGWVGLGLLLVAATSFGATTPFPGSAALLPVIGTVLLLVAGATRHAGGVSALLAKPLPAYIGRISYGWYLWHWPCLVLARRVATGGLTVDPEGGPAPTLSPGWVAVVVLGSLALAAVSSVLVEQPVRRGRWLAVLPRRSLAMGAALTVLSVFSATALASTQPTAGPQRPPASGSAADAAPSVPQPLSSGSASAAPPQRGRVWPVATSLRVTPLAARADIAWAPGCFLNHAMSYPQPTCQFGDPNGTVVMALVGDSHAAQWLPAARRLAKARGWQLWFWAKSNCALQEAPVYLPVAHRAYPECVTWRTRVQARLAALPRLDVLVLAHASGYPNTLVGKDGHLMSRNAAAATWEATSATLYRRLEAGQARRIVVLTDTPRPNADIPSCLSQHTSRPDACDFPRARAVEPDAPLLAGERVAARGLARVVFITMTDYLCPGDPCPATTPDGLIVYRDQSHLTTRFAASIWRELGLRIDAAVKGSGG
ncbi:MAG: hypothetical protein QOJ90_2490, partial [Actinomycetota bacterium]|nr:hypothetical protein [Actinomycetota bacterium]